MGETDFVDWIKEGFLRGDRSKREQPALRQLRKAFEPEELIEHFVHLTDMDKEEVCKRGKNSFERAMLMEFLYRFCQITQPQIGRLVGGIETSAVSRARKRWQAKLQRQLHHQKIYNELKDQLTELSRIKI